MGYIRNELEEAVGKKWTKRFIGFGIVLFIYTVISFFAGIWPFSSAVGVAKRVTEPVAIIHNYEWFYDQYHAIEAQRRNVAAMPEGSTDRIGTQMVLNNMIAEYNAKSWEITRNLWKADDLPYQIGE
jgi:valyl-tRNA synthetase